MPEPQLLHESTVLDSEIDSLGHMNVRFYIARAGIANERLLQQVGVAAGPGMAIRRVDIYSKFQREQFAGAPLEVQGGLIDVEGPIQGTGVNGAINGYYEIRNPDSGAIAASFIISNVLVETASQQVHVPVALTEATRAPYRIQIPEHGLPRSLSLATPKVVSIEELDPLISEAPVPGMMSGRFENTIAADMCDENGRLREEVDLMAALFRPTPGSSLKHMGPPQLRDEEGRRYSWAMMETRTVTYGRPFADETILALSADVAWGEKWRQSRRWMFSRASSELLGISDSLGLCMDLDARRAIPIPAELRPQLEANCLPQLR